MPQAYESALLEPGFFVGLDFREGPIFFVIKGRETTKVIQHFSDARQAVATDPTFATPLDSQNRNLLEPDRTTILHQVFSGFAPSNARVYVNFPTGAQTKVLRGVRSIGGEVGFISGWESPYHDPSPLTEIWCTQNNWPDYDVWLTPGVRFGQSIRIHHVVNRYTYGVVIDKDLIKQFVRRERRVKMASMGSPDALVNMPSFLADSYLEFAQTATDEAARAFGTVGPRPA